MTSRKRFQETMSYGSPDRVPLFDEGIRDDVIAAWKKQGLDKDLNDIFEYDCREEIWLDHEPLPKLKKWPGAIHELESLKKRLNPDKPDRHPEHWKKTVKTLKTTDTIRMLRVHRGFYLSMGVGEWQRFMDVNYMLYDDPECVKKTLGVQAEFSAQLAQKVLHEIEIDAAIFSEPIGGNDGSLISPRMYEEFALKSYAPILEVLKQYKIETIILRTYANIRILIPLILQYGFNCLWVSEIDSPEMEYCSLRREFGKDLRLIGGINLNALRKNKEAIRQEVEEKATLLLAEGGYVPLASGRVREDVSFENYLYYRRLLKKMAI